MGKPTLCWPNDATPAQPRYALFRRPRWAEDEDVIPFEPEGPHLVDQQPGS
jgi:hypothetical protein